MERMLCVDVDVDGDGAGAKADVPSAVAAVVATVVGLVLGLVLGAEPEVGSEVEGAVVVNVPVAVSSFGEYQFPAPPRPECAYSCCTLAVAAAAAALESGCSEKVCDSMSWFGGMCK